MNRTCPICRTAISITNMTYNDCDIIIPVGLNEPSLHSLFKKSDQIAAKLIKERENGKKNCCVYLNGFNAASVQFLIRCSQSKLYNVSELAMTDGTMLCINWS